MDLLQFSKKQRIKAAKLIKETNILKILKQVGKPSIFGSYEHDLMYDPDIDINVKCRNPRESSLKALELFLKDRNFQKFQFGDFVKFKRAKRPSGYIICLQKNIEKTKREIEIWFFSKEKEDYLKNKKITKTQKIEILKAKHKRATEKSSKHNLSSYQIYKKILN